MVATSIARTNYQVMTGAAALEDCVKRAQVLIVGEHSWHLIGAKPYRMHCLSSFAPVPAVRCPRVDVGGVKDDERMGRIMMACVSDAAGVINMDGLLTGLEALGGKVERVPMSSVKCQVPGKARRGKRIASSRLKVSGSKVKAV